jgi:hypothetical protein
MEPNMEIELEIIMDNITIDMIHEFCLRKLGIPEKRQHLIDTILLEKSQTNIYEFPERKLVGTFDSESDVRRRGRIKRTTFL